MSEDELGRILTASHQLKGLVLKNGTVEEDSGWFMQIIRYD